MKTDHPKLPHTFPESWAHSYGQDDYGIWHGVYIEGIEVRFRWIPPGEFMMGSPEDKEKQRAEPERLEREGPQHRVTIEQGFWLAETTCTQELWQAVMGDNPSRYKDDPHNPVENISWENTQEFLTFRTLRESEWKFRLPSEAEWEYACRAGSKTAFWWGDDLTTDQANYDGNHPYNKGRKGEFRESTLPVKSFAPNPWGLYQMHGNIWEWCQDRWHDDYRGAPDNGKPWEEGDSEYHVCRGGSWIFHGRRLRSAYRLRGIIADDFIGFRLARGPESSSQAGAEASLGRHEGGTTEAASS